MFGKIFKKIVGTQNDRRVRKMYSVVQRVNAFEAGFSALSNKELVEKTAELRARVPDTDSKDELKKSFEQILPEAFALVRETSLRA